MGRPGCTQPAWMQQLLSVGFPVPLAAGLCIVNGEYYWDNLPTCVAADPTPTKTCPFNSHVCAGLLGHQYGTLSRQVDLIVHALGTDKQCLADGLECSPYKKCCNPYSRCTW